MNAYIFITFLVLYATMIGYIVRQQARQYASEIEFAIDQVPANTRLFKIVAELLTAFGMVLAGAALLLAAVAMLMLARGFFTGTGKIDSVFFVILPCLISLASHCLGLLGLAKIGGFVMLALRQTWQKEA